MDNNNNCNDNNNIINNIPNLEIIENNPIKEGNKLLKYFNKKWTEYEFLEKGLDRLIQDIKNNNNNNGELKKEEKDIILNDLKLIENSSKSQTSNIVHCLLIVQNLLNKKIIASVLIKLLTDRSNTELKNIKVMNKLLESVIQDIEKNESLRKNERLYKIVQSYYMNKSNQKIINDLNKFIQICLLNDYILKEEEQVEEEKEINNQEDIGNNNNNNNNNTVSLEIQFQNIKDRLELPLYKYHLSSLDSFIENVNKDTKLSLEDISSSIKSYITTTLPILMLDCAAIPFELDKNNIIKPTCDSITTLSNKSIKEIESILWEFLEYYIMVHLNNRIFSSIEFMNKDKRINENISKFKNITPKNLDLNSNLISDQFIDQIKEQLQCMIKVFKSPREKLLCIKEIFNLIFQLLSEIIDNAGADLLLPTVIYCIIKSNLPLLLSNLNFITMFRNSNLLESETEYFIVTLDSALSFIENMTEESLTFEPSI